MNVCVQAEFTIFMALRADLVEREDVEECLEAFTKLDQNQSGTITIDDCFFVPDRAAALGREKASAGLSKLEVSLNTVSE